MSAIAHQFNRVSRIVTVGAAVLFAIRDFAVTGRMRAFVGFSHLCPLLQSMQLLLTRRQRLSRKTFHPP